MTANKLALLGAGMVLCVSTVARGQTLPEVDPGSWTVS